MAPALLRVLPSARGYWSLVHLFPSRSVSVCVCVCHFTLSFTGPWLSALRGCRGLETVEIGCRMCLFLSPCTAERQLVADGHVFSLTVCGLTRIYSRPVPVPVLFLLVLGFGRFASSACVFALLPLCAWSPHAVRVFVCGWSVGGWARRCVGGGAGGGAGGRWVGDAPVGGCAHRVGPRWAHRPRRHWPDGLAILVGPFPPKKQVFLNVV